MRTFLFILLAGLLGACSDDGELNGAVEADNLELSKNELKLSNVAGSSTVDITLGSCCGRAGWRCGEYVAYLVER